MRLCVCVCVCVEEREEERRGKEERKVISENILSHGFISYLLFPLTLIYTYNLFRFEEGAFPDLFLHEKHFKTPVSAISFANLCGRRERRGRKEGSGGVKGEKEGRKERKRRKESVVQDKRSLVFGGPSFIQVRCTTIVITRPYDRRRGEDS